jgi:hypothetical protein
VGHIFLADPRFPVPFFNFEPTFQRGGAIIGPLVDSPCLGEVPMKHTKITPPESPLDRPLSVAFFRDLKALKMTDHDISLRDLAAKNPVAKSKDLMGHIKLGKFSGKPTPRRSYRHNAAHLEVSGIEGDYDEGTMTVDEAAAALKAADVAAMI